MWPASVTRRLLSIRLAIRLCCATADTGRSNVHVKIRAAGFLCIGLLGLVPGLRAYVIADEGSTPGVSKNCPECDIHYAWLTPLTKVIGRSTGIAEPFWAPRWQAPPFCRWRPKRHRNPYHPFRHRATTRDRMRSSTP